MYRLDGFDKDWITVGESPIVTYSNLWHGDYQFRVKASNSDGIWGPEEQLLYIHIRPPFIFPSGLIAFIYCCLLFALYILSGISSNVAAGSTAASLRSSNRRKNVRFIMPR